MGSEAVLVNAPKRDSVFDDLSAACLVIKHQPVLEEDATVLGRFKA